MSFRMSMVHIHLPVAGEPSRQWIGGHGLPICAERVSHLKILWHGSVIIPGEDNDPERRHAVAAAGSSNTIQASDDEFEAVLSQAITSIDLRIGRRNPRGTIPGGEAEVVQRGEGGPWTFQSTIFRRP